MRVFLSRSKLNTIIRRVFESVNKIQNFQSFFRYPNPQKFEFETTKILYINIL